MLAIDIPTQINQMLAEIESGMAKTGVDFASPIHNAYIVASLELNSPDPDRRYVYNLLAMSLNKPLATRH